MGAPIDPARSVAEARQGNLPPTPPAERLAAWADRLRALPDPQTRLAHLVEAARCLPPLPEGDRQEAHRVTGCLVRTWWIAQWRDGRCWFRTDSDAMTLKCLAGAIAELASGGTPDEIAALEFGVFDALGLLRQLAENRRRTVRQLMDGTREFARRCACQAQAPGH
ncbi:MAG: SufE family protein [Verrucomicrobia bacterium]|nr:SufE family protein [Verrucomicrobiota bacterium]